MSEWQTHGYDIADPSAWLTTDVGGMDTGLLSWNTTDDMNGAFNNALLSGFANVPTSTQVTTKIPPTYSGATLWFSYEEAA